MLTRHHPRIACLGHKAVHANDALLPRETPVRRLHATHQIRLVKLPAGEVHAVLDGNISPPLLYAALEELSVELFRVYDAGVSPELPEVLDEVAGCAVEAVCGEVVVEEAVRVVATHQLAMASYGGRHELAVVRVARLDLCGGDGVHAGIRAGDGWVVVETDAEGVSKVILRLTLYAVSRDVYGHYNTLVADGPVARVHRWLGWFDIAVRLLYDVAHVIVARCFGLNVATAVKASDNIAGLLPPTSLCYYQRREEAFVRAVDLVGRRSLAIEHV